MHSKLSYDSFPMIDLKFQYCKETEKLFVYSCLIFSLLLLLALETTVSLGIFVAV